MSHYIEQSTLAEDLVNTYDPTREDPEHLREPLDLRGFLENRGIEVNGSVSHDDLEEVRALREQLRAVFAAADDAAAVDSLNTLLGASPLLPHLAEDTDGGWRLHLEAPAGASLARRVAAEAALGLATAVERYGAERLRQCGADTCFDVFLDTSRNRSRRYCSISCANRQNVAAFRRRQREG